jgi:nucleoside-diphosphate-sugar epimerase
MKVLILGGAGMLGPYVIPVLEHKYDLIVTDIKRPPLEFRGEFRMVDVANYEQVMDAAEGVDAIINLSVLRHDRKIAFDVNAMGCYNMMEAAVKHGIKRIINTGPHFTVAGATYESYDYEISPDIPPHPGTLLYSLSKSVGHEICRVYAEHYDIYVQMYLYYNFRDPEHPEREREVRPFAISWQSGGEVYPYGLDIPLEKLPSRFETFFIFSDMPHGRFSNEKAKRILGWQPRNDISVVWRRDDVTS